MMRGWPAWLKDQLIPVLHTGRQKIWPALGVGWGVSLQIRAIGLKDEGLIDVMMSLKAAT